MESTEVTGTKSKASKFGVFFATIGGLLLLVITTAAMILLGVGRWLVDENPLQPATAIVVLSGNMPTRALEAAALYHQGYAKQIWLTHPETHASALKQLGISYPSEDDFNLRVLRRAGVPMNAVRVLDSSIVNTAEELGAIHSALQESGGNKVIIVTNKSHTRRVHILWAKYFGNSNEIITHGIPDDDFVAGHWWRDPGSLTQVTHEVLGIANAWAGLPVQRVPHPAPEVTADSSNPPNHSAASQVADSASAAD